jgi:hypothetical protein
MYSLATLISTLVFIALASAFIYAVICFVNSKAYDDLRAFVVRRNARYKRSVNK